MDRALVPSEVRKQQLEAWMAEYCDTVFRTCYLYLADRTLAEDATQDTFLKVWRTMDSFEGRNGCSIKTWIIRIAINTCKNYKNSAWHRRIDKSRLLDDLPPSVLGVTEESHTMFLEILQLPDKCKQVIILYYYHDMTMADIGNILKISRSAVQHRLNKALALLRVQWKGSDWDEN